MTYEKIWLGVNHRLPGSGISFGSSESCTNIDDCRTLWSIISACLGTIGACTWVSVHPNVPARDDGMVARGLHRLKLMVLGIIAPEIIIVWALRQWIVARGLSTSKLPLLQDSNTDTEWNFLWVRTHWHDHDHRILRQHGWFCRPEKPEA